MKRLSRTAGFSLVELMVAMVIGLFGTIVIFQVFSLSEKQKRLTTGASDAQQNGLLALFTLEREIRVAGFGFSYLPLLGCNVVAHDQTGPRDFNYTLTAAQITDGAAGAPDSLTLAYGNSGLLVAPGKLFSNMVAGETATQVDNPYGYRRGDILVIGEVGKSCTMRQITNNPAGNATAFRLDHVPGNYTTEVGGNTVASRYNKAGGVVTAYTAWDNTLSTGARVFSLGNAPIVSTYAVSGSQLTYTNLMTSAASTPVVDGIIQMQAQYGKDTTADGVVDVWNATAPTNAAEWAQVIALRVAVVARSVDRERNPDGSPCSSTGAQPTWAGGTITINTDPDWQCYRYRVFETKVPIRNLIWLP